MRLLDCLKPERVLCTLEDDTLEGVLLRLLGTAPEGTLPPSQREKSARDLGFGSRGEIVRVHSDVIAVVAEQEGLTGTIAFLGTSAAGFTVTAEGKEPPGRARGVFLFLVPGRPTTHRARIVPELRRLFADEDVASALLSAPDGGEALAIQGLADVAFPEHPQVGEAVRPARYRVYPESPMDELIDLMVRRSLHAVPVVGEGYEVLGIITTGDALSYIMAQSGTGSDGPGTARDVMTRAVLCVSEDQELREVAQLMANRDVEQLPVVRDGQLVGLVTRDSVLAALSGGTPEPD